MNDIPRRRALVDGLHVKFESRDPKLATVRWHSRFKLRYRTKVDAVAAKRAWEDEGRIIFPADIKAAKPRKAPSSKPIDRQRRSATASQQEMTL